MVRRYRFAAAIERDDYLENNASASMLSSFRWCASLAYRRTVCHSEPRPKKRSGISQATPTPSATQPAATRNTRLSASLSVSGSYAAADGPDAPMLAANSPPSAAEAIVAPIARANVLEPSATPAR